MQRKPVSITEIQAPSTAAECSRLRKVIGRIAGRTLGSRIATNDMVLAFGEALSNAVKYGHDGPISVRVETFPGHELAVEMAYPGTQFDTEVSFPHDVRSALGGFGRFIMSSVTDNVEYTFQNGQTILRMTKRC